MPIGQRLDAVPKYIKHPVTGAWWQDGKPIDAGTAHIVHSNLSHLSAESLRHIAALVGPGAIETFDSTKDDQWDDFELESPREGDIPWSQPRDAVKVGPIYLPEFEIISGGPRLVGVRFFVEGRRNGASAGEKLKVLFALTTGEATPAQSFPVVHYEELYQNPDTDFVLDVTLPTGSDPALQIAGSGSWPCRTPGTGASTSVTLPFLYAWVGWFSTDALAGNLAEIKSINIWEAYE